MVDQLDTALQYAHKNYDRFLGEYKEILRIPSVSTDPARAGDVQRAAEWLVSQLRGLGMQKV